MTFLTTLINKVMKICKCGCGATLRKDNKSGFKNGHKPCPVCGGPTGSTTECCSKSCASKLHWQRHPEMKEARIWNSDRYATRETNRDKWVKNLSKARAGKDPWNKGKKGVQVPWNKDLPSEQQPRFNVKSPANWYEKYKKTNLEKYGLENPGILAKTLSRSKKEKQLENILLEYEVNKRIGRYKPDYVNEKTKHIIEVYGNYWHCNPKYFDENFYHTQLKMTAKEKWIADENRIQYLEDIGYSVTIVWESDLNDYIKNLKDKP